MVLLSLEDSKEITLCGGGKRRHDWTHPGECLQATGQQRRATERDARNAQYGCCLSPCRHLEGHTSTSQGI